MFTTDAASRSANCWSDFLRLLANRPVFLDDAAKTQVSGLGKNLVGLYSALPVEAINSGIRAWKMTPKLHCFQHLCEWQMPEYGNGKFYWAYCDEDLGGHVIEVATSTHPRTMCETALFKWLVFVFDVAD